MDKVFFALGAVCGFLGVALGAFAAHALKSRLDVNQLMVFEVAVRYQMYHAFALLAVGWAHTRWPGTVLTTSGWLFVIGTVVFFRQPICTYFDRYTMVRGYHAAWGACATRWLAMLGVGSVEGVVQRVLN